MRPDWRSLGPAVPATPPHEALRAALGAGLGLIAADLILWAMTSQGPALGQSLLIAPFGATAFLIFAVPNSPLAQPWPAVVGNTLSAVAGLIVLRLGLPVVPAIGLAVALAMLAMSATRALHPPGGAVAIATVLADPDPVFALVPVLTATALLVALGMVWSRATGRRYPFRLPTAAPAQRHVPGPTALAAALSGLRLGANLGVEDLARLIAAAEAVSAAEGLGPMSAQSVMSRDLITLTEGDSPDHATALFRQHGFRHLPLLDSAGRYAGLVPLTALLGPQPGRTLRDLVAPDIATIGPETPLTEVVTLLARGTQICLPVVAEGRLAGLITRSDLLAALSHGNPSREEPK